MMLNIKGPTINDLGGGKSKMNLFFPQKGLLKIFFLEKASRNLFFPGEGLSKFIFFLAGPSEIYFFLGKAS